MSLLKTYNVSDIAAGVLNINKLNDDIESSGFVTDYENITLVKGSNDIPLYGGSFNDEDGVDDIVANHLANTLKEVKAQKSNAIDAKTDELVSLGYTYKSKQFSLSPNAQTNILALFVTKDSPAIVYPIEYNTLDDADNYFVTDAADLEAMYLTALGTKKARIDSGTALKDQVRAATTIAQVEAIIDNR